MYFNKYNNFFHGIMFHHFHDGIDYRKSDGSIDRDDLYKLIKFIGKKNILDANDFYLRLKKKKLKKNHLCLTFDDSLKSQYDIALPVVEDLNIKSFFFVYSSALTKKPDFLEIFRHFRTNYFDNNDHFYKNFLKICINLIDKRKINSFLKKNEEEIKKWKVKFPFYSLDDIKFRFIRNKFLSRKNYKRIMLTMFNENNFDYKLECKNLFLSTNNVKKLSKLGHIIGLHSHNHPIMIEKKSSHIQKNEYKNNKKFLEKIINKKIFSMSHPFGSYNEITLKILSKLNIDIGFKQTLRVDEKLKKINNSVLEIAREDHSNIMSRIEK